MKREAFQEVSILHLMSHAEPVSPTREVHYVEYYQGATVLGVGAAIKKNKQGKLENTWGAFTLGSFITAGRGVKADPADKVFQHEYGHYLQSQKFGLLYIPKVAFPSLISASGNGHKLSHVEQDASWRGLNYFYHHVPGFNKWDFDANPLGENYRGRIIHPDYGKILSETEKAKINW